MSKLLAGFIASLRGRLILGVVLLQATVMALFVWDLTQRQQAILLERQEEQAVALAGSIATSAAGWLAARDFYGLQEIIQAQAYHADLLYAMILDVDGQVLAHTDRTRLGQYVLDLPPPSEASGAARFLHRSAEAVDVLQAVRLANRNIGWVRIGLGQQTTARRLADISGYMTPRELAEKSAAGQKQPDAVWIAKNNARIAVELGICL
ncbi:MAG: hypothetical protein N2690_03340, partial [Rhodocyclaceae bacterium]|nr:hypothetical protein [Rhodocyclaceae bacterium]